MHEPMHFVHKKFGTYSIKKSLKINFEVNYFVLFKVLFLCDIEQKFEIHILGFGFSIIYIGPRANRFQKSL